MSMPLLLRQTPISHPRLFVKVPFGNVQRGDIFQGKRDESKWFENTDPSQKQSRHTYWRAKAPAKKKKSPARKPASKKKPVKKTAKRRR